SKSSALKRGLLSPVKMSRNFPAPALWLFRCFHSLLLFCPSSFYPFQLSYAGKILPSLYRDTQASCSERVYILLYIDFKFIRRNTCSAVSDRFCPAVSGSIASSKVEVPLTTGKNASIPFSLHFTASLVTLPEKATTVFPYFFARLATPTGAFPIAVCPSRRPSPVTTTSASFT